MSVIRLTTCNDIIEANLKKGMLENNGIRCFLTNENFSNLMPHYNGIMGSGVQIMINDTDLEEAQQLISMQAKANDIVCPHCGSLNVKFGLGKSKVKKLFTIILSLLTWIPFGNIKNTYYCQNCKTEFKL